MCKLSHNSKHFPDGSFRFLCRSYWIFLWEQLTCSCWHSDFCRWFLVSGYICQLTPGWLVGKQDSFFWECLPCAPVGSTFSISLLMLQRHSKLRCAFLWLLSQTISSNNSISGSFDAVLLAFYIVTGLFFKLLPISSTQLVRETLKALLPLTCLNSSPSYCYFWVTLDSWASPAWPVINIRQRQAPRKPEQSDTGSDSTAVIKCMAWLWGHHLCKGDFTFGMCLSSFPFLCDGWTFCTCALCHLHIPACVLHVDLGYRVPACMLCMDLG